MPPRRFDAALPANAANATTGAAGAATSILYPARQPGANISSRCVPHAELSGV